MYNIIPDDDFNSVFPSSQNTTQYSIRNSHTTLCQNTKNRKVEYDDFWNFDGFTLGSPLAQHGSNAVINNPNICSKYRMLKYIDRTTKFNPCYSPTCDNPFCRSKWSMKQHNILKESFKTKQPSHFVTLSFLTDLLPKYEDVKKWLTSFNRKMKSDKTFEYYSQIELSPNYLLHVHLLLMTSLTKNAICQKIKDSVTVETNVKIEECRSELGGLARYITKDMAGHAGIRFPLAYKGRGRRLTGCSARFLADAKERLWDAAKQSFALSDPSSPLPSSQKEPSHPMDAKDI